MLKWAFLFLIIGVILGVLGFGGIGGVFVGLAKVLFFIVLAVFLILLVLGLMAGKAVKDTVGRSKRR